MRNCVLHVRCRHCVGRQWLSARTRPVFGIGNLKSVLDWPILIGPFAEYHIIPPVALTLDVKAGPHLTSFGNSGFGLRALFGLAVRL